MIPGLKTILFDAEPSDVPYLATLYRQHTTKLTKHPLDVTEAQLQQLIQTNLANGSWHAYIGMTKEQEPRRLGCFYLTNMTDHACTINGMLDEAVLKGLAKRLKKSHKMGPTFAEDAMRSLLDVLQIDKERIDVYIQSSNALALRLCRVVGFQQEGCLRKAVRVNGHAEDLIILAVVKEV